MMWRGGERTKDKVRFFASLFERAGFRSTFVPENIRDQLRLHQYQQIHRQIPTLYAAVMSIVLGSGVAMTEAFPMIFRVALPAVVMSICLIRLRIWTQREMASVTAEAADRHLKALFYVAVLICVITSLWSLVIYFGTQVPYRGRVPIFIAIAAISSACCLSSVPRVAITVLISTLLPTCIALLLSRDQVLVAMAFGLFIVVTLQARLIITQFAQTVNAISLQQQMRQLADSDALTGLANRRAFLAAVEADIGNPERSDPLTIAMIDLDDFKPVNDRFGHYAGDEVLRITATRLQSLCTPYGFAARLGGDEFALLLDKPISPGELHALAKKILADTAKPCLFDGRSAKVTACIGWAQWPSDGKTADDVIRAADRALYAAKYSGRSKVTPFSSLSQNESAPKPKRLRAA
jgi:diguanylate cyclase